VSGAQDAALRAGVVLDALAAEVPLESLGSAVVSGAPEAGVLELGVLGETEFGLWEHTVGTSTDVEADEVFVVLSGHGSVEIEAFGDSPRHHVGAATRLRGASGRGHEDHLENHGDAEEALRGLRPRPPWLSPPPNFSRISNFSSNGPIGLKLEIDLKLRPS
jgi:uncharacterized cupin superfamily protein